MEKVRPIWRYVNATNCTETTVKKVPGGWYVVHNSFHVSATVAEAIVTSVSGLFVPDGYQLLSPTDFRQRGEEEVAT